MADISTIVGVDGSSYTIKDATARGLLNGHSVNKDVPANAEFTDTTYESKQAASGGTDLSLVTTGEKYNWNNASGSGAVEELRNTLTQVGNSQNAVEDAIAYVQDGDTASRVYTEGQFIYLKNHVTLPEGLYTVNSGGIANGTSITGKVTANSNGGLNVFQDMLPIQYGHRDLSSLEVNDTLTVDRTGFYLLYVSPSDGTHVGQVRITTVSSDPSLNNWTVCFVSAYQGSNATSLVFLRADRTYKINQKNYARDVFLYF